MIGEARITEKDLATYAVTVNTGEVAAASLAVLISQHLLHSFPAKEDFLAFVTIRRLSAIVDWVKYETTLWRTYPNTENIMRSAGREVVLYQYPSKPVSLQRIAILAIFFREIRSDRVLNPHEKTLF